MPGSIQGSARPCPESTSPRNDTQVDSVEPAPVDLLGSRAPSAAELDSALFTAPYTLLGTDNTGCGTATTEAAAWAAFTHCAAVATVVGTLREGYDGVDVDPSDTGADTEAGDAVAEQLASWADRYGLARHCRASGRPGGRHLIIRVPEALADELRQVARRLARHHGVSVTVRPTLRLLAAPHRHGHAAPTLETTFTTADFLPASEHQIDEAASQLRRRRKITVERGTDQPDLSLSASEYGRACAMVRAGMTAAEAWRRMGSCQVNDMR